MQHAIIFVLLVGIVAVSQAAEGGGYTTKYDNLNIDEILKNSRLVDNYVDCLLDKRRCSDEGRTLKEIVPDALITDCVKCNDKQRASVEKIMKFLVRTRKAQFDLLVAKYDPKGIYLSKYEKYL